MPRFLAYCFIAFTMASCAGVSDDLSDSGKEIVILKKIENESEYKFLKSLVCRSGVFSKTPAINIERCRRELKNRAGALGATHMIVSIRNISAQTNVVVMSAQAYKKLNN